MKKKITAHKLDNFKFEIASGYTIKISPTSGNKNIVLRATVTEQWSFGFPDYGNTLEDSMNTETESCPKDIC